MTRYANNRQTEKQVKEAALIRMAGADLAYRILLCGGENYPGIQCWQLVCEDAAEFNDVRNEIGVGP